MPFQSEKQRRYLWANEPEIARDWTDTYGSKIHKASGGRIGFARGSDPRALKQRFIEIIQAMSQASGEKLTALVVEAQRIKQQLEDLARIEPSTGQGIQGISRGLRMEGPEILEASIKKQVDPDFRIYPEGYEREQIFPGRKPDRIIEEQIVGITPERTVRPVSGSMRGLSRENRDKLKRLWEKRLQKGSADKRVRKQGGGIIQSILMQLAQKWGIDKAMKMLGMGDESDEDNNIPSGYFGNYNLSPMKSLTRFGLNQAFKGLTGQGSGIGFGGGFLPMAGIAGLAYLGNKHRLGLTGYTTQGGYEKARQDRINMQRQSNIIKTLESGKYAPGWEKTAFENVQRLGKDLNLVDAADVGLTRKSKPKPRTSYPSPARPHGGGGDKNQGGGGGKGFDPGGGAAGSPFNRGGLAGLWQR
mgnify:CR=1 FL=1